MLKQENAYGSQQVKNGEAEPDTKSLSYVHYMDLKKSGAEWKKTFSSYIKNTLEYSACIGADDNFYLRAEKDEDGNEYYSYLFVYVEDVLSIH